MVYLTEKQLRHYSKQSSMYDKVIFEASRKNVFLSHSHKDKELVQYLQNMFLSLGIDLYIDWNDKDISTVTDRKTAEQIKKKIDSMEYFFILATNNAMLSRWVPWEIGIADALKQDKICIIPVEDDSGDFIGNEYLQIYNRLELNNGNLEIVDIKNSRTDLKEYLYLVKTMREFIDNLKK